MSNDNDRVVSCDWFWTQKGSSGYRTWESIMILDMMCNEIWDASPKIAGGEVFVYW